MSNGRNATPSRCHSAVCSPSTTRPAATSSAPRATRYSLPLLDHLDIKWAYWLKDTIPGARRVIEVADSRLFFPEDRPEALAKPMLAFWDEEFGG
jgi:hypothetical protein